GGRVIAFAARGGVSLVGAAIQIATARQPPPEVEGGANVVRLGRANESVVLNIEPRPERLKGASNLVHMLPRREPAASGDALDVDAVLVGAGEQEHTATTQAGVAGDRIGGGGGGGGADVRELVCGKH